MKKYELWLDETGGFTAEEQISGIKNRKNKEGDGVYSIIGGVLSPVNYISMKKAAELAGFGAGHAMEMKPDEWRSTIIPAMKEMADLGVKFVMFENRKRYTREDQVDLYMEMMVDGILQVISMIAVFEKEFQLDIMIANRQVEIEENVLTMISQTKYSDALKKTLSERIRYGYMSLDEDVQVNVLFASAREEPKLILADYACSARRAILRGNDSRIHDDEVDMFCNWFDENFIFDSYEYSIMGQVKKRLADNRIAEAVLLLCDFKNLRKDVPKSYLKANGKKIQQKIKWLIFKKMERLGRIELRFQLEELISELSESIQMEDEYQWGEHVLDVLRDEFLEGLKQFEVRHDKLYLMLYISYAYLYKREGNLKAMEQALGNLKKCQDEFPQSINYLGEKIRFGVLRESLSLLNGDLEQAKEMDTKIIESFKAMEEALACVGLWDEERESVPNAFQREVLRLKELRIYLSILHEQAEEEEIDELKKEVDSMKNHSMEDLLLFPRGCFRYLIDCGDVMGAFSLLLRFVRLEDGLWEETTDAVNRKRAEALCAALGKINGRQKTELVREYVYLMKAMKEQGYKENEILWTALERSSLLPMIGKEESDQVEMHMKKRPGAKNQYLDLVQEVLHDSQDKIYHPVELIWGILSSYFALDGKKEDLSMKYYTKALQLCDQNKEYAMMQKSLLMIRAEHSGRKLLKGVKKPEAEFKKLKEVYDQVVESDAMTKELTDYLKNLWSEVLTMMDQGMDSSLIGSELLLIAKKMEV